MPEIFGHEITNSGIMSALLLPVLPEVGLAKEAILFHEIDILGEIRCVAEAMTGRVMTREGEAFVFLCEPSEKLPHLLCLKIFKEHETKPIGSVDALFLPQIREIDIGYFDLGVASGRGLGKLIALLFRSHLPAGVRMRFKLLDKETRGFLSALVDQMMDEAQIVDWRRGTVLRPTVENGTYVLLPETDRKAVEKRFLEKVGDARTPLLGVFRAFDAAFEDLLIALNGDGEWVFELRGILQNQK